MSMLVLILGLAIGLGVPRLVLIFADAFIAERKARTPVDTYVGRHRSWKGLR